MDFQLGGVVVEELGLGMGVAGVSSATSVHSLIRGDGTITYEAGLCESGIWGLIEPGDCWYSYSLFKINLMRCILGF